MNIIGMLALKWVVIIGTTQALRKAAQHMENKP